MDILGVGPLELAFILLIALIILGPKDMVNSGRTIGRFLRKIVTSPSWHLMQQTSRDIKNIPSKLIRDAGLEDIQEQLNNDINPNDVFELDAANNEIGSIGTELNDWTTIPLDNPLLPSSDEVINHETDENPSGTTSEKDINNSDS